jgi:2-polyprenyl-3-methyl-5-hydroxy-6-metoxy-1,4-benzoquinol methylase
MTTFAKAYAEKPVTYFAGARHDIVGRLEDSPSAAILEVGCGTGATGRAALAAGKAGRYVGIELDPRAAGEAAKVFPEVLVGDVEQMEFSAFHDSFDVLILSEVLEHLIDPWTMLNRLVACLRVGGAVYASSPNIAHWRLIANLVRGRFVYAADGVMDRTHLRWFTSESFRAMFEAAGVNVTSVGPLVPLGRKARFINRVAGGRLTHLFMSQVMLTGERAD